MRKNAHVALALMAALGGLAGVDNPLQESKRALDESSPRATRRPRQRMTQRSYDPAKEKAKRKQAKKSKAANRKR